MHESSVSVRFAPCERHPTAGPGKPQGRHGLPGEGSPGLGERRHLLNYAAALTGVRPRAYVPATVIGIVPGTFAYAALGGTAADPLSAPFLGAVGLVVALAAAGTLARRRLDRAG